MKKNILLLLVICVVYSCSGPLEKPIELNGPWYFQTDAEDVGISDKWFAQDFDFSQKDTISLKDSWEVFLEKEYDGVGWYFCEFSYPPRTQQIALSLRTFDDPCQIWLNGQEVGGIQASSERMKIELTQFILQGRNRIAIRIEDQAGNGGLRGRVKLVPFRNLEEFSKIQ